MFGYVAPLKSELKVREFEVYNAYYCAICRAVKRRYGQLPRLLLSYDAVFFAMLAASLAGGAEALSFHSFRCFNNPAKKRNEAAPSAAIDYAADILAFLGWLSLKDRNADRDARNAAAGAAAFLGEAALRGAGRRAGERLGGKARACRECIAEQTALEAAKTPELDRAADPTGRFMAELMDFTDVPALREGLAARAESCAHEAENLPAPLPLPELSEKLRALGYHLGRYIYMVDAADDLEKDQKSGAYNALLIKPIPAETLKTGISLDLARLGEISSALPLVYNKNIMDNIIYLGLNARLDEVLAEPK